MKCPVRHGCNVTLLLFALFFIAACSSNPQKIDHSEFEKEKITYIQVNPGHKFAVESSSTGISTGGNLGGIGGSLGTVVGLLAGSGYDRYIESRRKKNLEPILQALGEYDVDQELVKALQRIKGYAFKPNPKVYLATAPGHPPSKVLAVYLRVTMMANHRKLTGVAATRYRSKDEDKYHVQEYHSLPYIIDFGEHIDGDPTKFLVENPDVLKKAVNVIVDELVLKIGRELGQPEETEESRGREDQESREQGDGQNT